MGSYFWEYYHFDYIFVILIEKIHVLVVRTPRILLSIIDPTHNWLLAPAPPSVETPGTGCWKVASCHASCLQLVKQGTVSSGRVKKVIVRIML